MIFLLLQHVFRQASIHDLNTRARSAGVSDADFQAFVVYAAAFLANMGNYKSFGDIKFIPRCSCEAFDAIIDVVVCSQDQSDAPEYLRSLYMKCKDHIFSSDEPVQHLGFRPNAYSAYYSSGMSKADIELVQRFMNHKRIAGWNTRVKKIGNDSTFEVWKAAVNQQELIEFEDFEGAKIRVVTGDFAPMLKRSIEYLKKAKAYANPTQSSMIEKYIESFTTGSLDAHKDASRFWIRDKGPVVESYIGFIETYRDPFGVRAEWEAFVAVVNKEQSLRFDELVNGAEELLKKLPWSQAYEKDTFTRPDFTSLDVIAFASSGIPAGINIPNYDEIRQSEGFKNVSLGNVLSASMKQDQITFLTPTDEELFKKFAEPAFQVQVGLHELLGHGSGKLFEKDMDGNFNFDHKNVYLPNFDTGKVSDQCVSSWYQPGDTWDSKFPAIGSSYEECRAECVGIYLCTEKQALSIFGHHDEQEANNVVYINWLMMARAGLVALEFYRPGAKTWGQAHMMARFAILQVMLEAGENFVTIDETLDSKGLIVRLDRSKIMSVGRAAVGKFLLQLQTYKATADFEHGKELYDKYTRVSERFLAYRELVLKLKQPRRIIIQPELKLNQDHEVELHDDFTADPEGMIQSFQHRFTAENDRELYEYWCEAAHDFKP